MIAKMKIKITIVEGRKRTSHVRGESRASTSRMPPCPCPNISRLTWTATTGLSRLDPIGDAFGPGRSENAIDCGPRHLFGVCLEHTAMARQILRAVDAGILEGTAVLDHRAIRTLHGLVTEYPV